MEAGEEGQGRAEMEAGEEGQGRAEMEAGEEGQGRQRWRQGRRERVEQRWRQGRRERVEQRAGSGEWVAHLVLEVPHSVFVGELLVGGAGLGEDAALEAAHVEEQVRVVLGVDGDEGVIPLHGGDGARQPVLDVPEHGPAAGEGSGTGCSGGD